MLYLNLPCLALIPNFIHYFGFIFFWCECSNRDNLFFLTHILGVGDIGPEGGCFSIWTECFVSLYVLWSGDVFSARAVLFSEFFRPSATRLRFQTAFCRALPRNLAAENGKTYGRTFAGRLKPFQKRHSRTGGNGLPPHPTPDGRDDCSESTLRGRAARSAARAPCRAAASGSTGAAAARRGF